MLKNSSRLTQSIPVTNQSSPSTTEHEFEKPLKRKYTNSPLRSNSRPLLSRGISFLSEMDEEDGTRWTRQHWKKLEDYYIRKDRDYEKAATAFYYCESLIRVTETDSKPLMKELWSKEKILWRCKCLDTRARYQHNTTPFIRKRHKTSSLSESGDFSVPATEKSSQTD